MKSDHISKKYFFSITLSHKFRVLQSDDTCSITIFDQSPVSYRAFRLLYRVCIIRSLSILILFLLIGIF